MQIFPMYFAAYFKKQSKLSTSAFDSKAMSEAYEIARKYQKISDYKKVKNDNYNLSKLAYTIAKSLHEDYEKFSQHITEKGFDLYKARSDISSKYGYVVYCRKSDTECKIDLSSSFTQNTRVYVAKINRKDLKASYENLTYPFAALVNAKGKGGVDIKYFHELYPYAGVSMLQKGQDIWFVLVNSSIMLRPTLSKVLTSRGKYGIQEKKTVVTEIGTLWKSLDQTFYKYQSGYSSELSKFSSWTRSIVQEGHKQATVDFQSEEMQVMSQRYPMFDPHLVVQELTLMRLYPEETYNKLVNDAEFKKAKHAESILTYLRHRYQDRKKEKLTASSYQRGWYIDPVDTYACTENTTSSCGWAYTYDMAKKQRTEDGTRAGWMISNTGHPEHYTGKFNIVKSLFWNAGDLKNYPCDDETVWKFIVYVLFRHDDYVVWQTLLSNKDIDNDLKKHKWEKNWSVATSYDPKEKKWGVGFMKYEQISIEKCPTSFDQSSNYFDYLASCKNQISYYLNRNDFYLGKKKWSKRDSKGFCKYNAPLDCEGNDANKPGCKKVFDCSSDENKNNAVCLDCDGKDKNTKKCLLCSNRDMTNKACYDCEGIDKNNLVCNKCPLMSYIHKWVQLKNSAGLCNATKIDCHVSKISDKKDDVKKCKKFVKEMSENYIKQKIDLEKSKTSCQISKTCYSLDAKISKLDCKIRDLNVAKVTCTYCPDMVKDDIIKNAPTMDQDGQIPPKCKDIDTCLKGIENTLLQFPQKLDKNLQEYSKALCQRDGPLPKLTLTQLIDESKLQLKGPKWDNKHCYDCAGIHSNLKICLDCTGKDANNAQCYDCSKDSDKTKKFCVCKNNPNDRMCYDCDGKDKENTLCCDIEGKDKENASCYDCKNFNKDTTYCKCKLNPNQKICKDCTGKDKNDLFCCDIQGKDKNKKACYDCNGKDINNLVCCDKAKKDLFRKECWDCAGADKNEKICCDIKGKDKNNDKCYDCNNLHKNTKHCQCKLNPNQKMCKDCTGKDKNSSVCCDIHGKDKHNKACYDCAGKDKDTLICCDTLGKDKFNKKCYDCAGKDIGKAVCCDIKGCDKNKFSCYDCAEQHKDTDYCKCKVDPK